MQCTAFFWIKFMKRYPRYVRVKSLPNENGVTQAEWLVRGISEEYTGTDGKTKIQTPEDLINRYYRCDTNVPKHLSIINTSQSNFLRYEELDRSSGYIEYT